MDLIAGQADYVLTRPGGHVPENLITNLWNHPAIQNVSPVLTTYTRIAQNGSEPFLLIGFDPILDRPLRNWRITPKIDQKAVVWFDLLKEPYTIILGEPLTRLLNREPGDRLLLEHVRQRSDFKIIGKLEREGLALAEGGRVALTDIATFQEFTGLFGKVDRIDLRLKPFASANGYCNFSGIHRPFW
jgi:putative ABC transport system permease protein